MKSNLIGVECGTTHGELVKLIKYLAALKLLVVLGPCLPIVFVRIRQHILKLPTLLPKNM